MTGSPRAVRVLRAIAVSAMLAGAGAARAQGLTALIEAGYLSGNLTLVDPAGRETTSSTIAFPQRYRLSYSQQLYPFLSLNASGLYEWTPATTNADGLERQSDGQRWNVFASANIGPPILNLTPYYLRRQEFATSQVLGQPVFTSPTLVNQGYGAFLAWNPAGLPVLGLKLSRNENFDSARAFQDTVTDEVQLTATYLDIPQLTLRYSARYTDERNRIQALEYQDLDQAAQVGWSGSWLDQRVAFSVMYNLGYRITWVDSSGGGFVTLQQFPVAGLSLVEVFPSVPSRNTLQPNPALIDGDVTSSAGLDIGYAPSLNGDVNFRDMGLQFANVSTPVNSLWIWVDRQLPPDVAGAFSWTAWQSDDNLSWTEVPITGPVIFGTFQNRFEIPIARTQARYLKVVTRPLAAAVTVDPRFADIFVTEAQAYLIVPASQAQRKTELVSSNLTTYLRLLFWREWNLAYDFSAFVAQSNTFAPNFWTITNGLSAGRRLTSVWAVSGQLQRTDNGVQGDHESVSRLNAMLSADPLPTIGAGLTYSGAVGQFRSGTIVTNSLTLLGHLDPWEGVNVYGSLGYTWARDQSGRTSNGANTVVSVTLAPMRTLLLAGTWSLNSGYQSGGSLPPRDNRQTLLQGTVSFTPIPAFSFSAGATRTADLFRSPQTLANFVAGFSPFPYGQLLIRFSYNETLESGSESRVRLYGPSLRWNIRPGSFLDMNYTWTETVQPALYTFGRTLFAQLTISLR